MLASSHLEFELDRENYRKPLKGFPGLLSHLLLPTSLRGQSDDPHLQMKTLRLRVVMLYAQEQTIRKTADAGFELKPHLTP